MVAAAHLRPGQRVLVTPLVDATESLRPLELTDVLAEVPRPLRGLAPADGGADDRVGPQEAGPVEARPARNRRELARGELVAAPDARTTVVVHAPHPRARLAVAVRVSDLDDLRALAVVLVVALAVIGVVHL